MKILIVEDENKIQKYLLKGLINNGFAAEAAGTAKEALNLLSIYEYDLLLLDLNLPDSDGIEVIKQLRKQENTIPVLMLTARTSQQEINEGFQSGTDDYLVKPFDFTELVFRINALIKRSKKDKHSNIKINEIIFDRTSKKLFLSKKEINLNNKELGIFEYLISNRGRVISQEELLEHVWDREINILTDTIRTNLKTLRKKIDPKKIIIKTVKGRGYVID